MYGFSDEQMGILVGSLMGDGSVINRNINSSALRIGHSIAQHDYLKYTKTLFEQLGIECSNISITNNSGYPAVRFTANLKTRGRELRRLFYPNGNKTISRHLLNFLTPVGLAIWYQDDGSKRLAHKNGRVNGREIKIATCNFTAHEHEIIQQYMRVVWDVSFRINSDYNKKYDKHYYYLVCAAAQANKFIDIISPFVHETMKYKIDLEYIKKPLQVASQVDEDTV